MTVRERLERLVGIDSIFPNERAMGEYMEGELKRLGFTTSRQYIEKDRFNLFADRGHGSKSLLFYGHMDTVPSYGRKEDPFTLFERGDRLYGLGSNDMKGGISAMLEALERCDHAKRIKVFLGVDEENISQGAWKGVKENREWFAGAGVCISCEPPVSIWTEGGPNVATIGRRGRVVIEIGVEGISCHGADPSKGVNALDEAAKIVVAMRKLKLGKAKGFGKETAFVSRMEGGETSLSVPDHARLELDIHTVPPHKSTDMTGNVQEFIKLLQEKRILDSRTKVTVQIKKRITPYIDPYVCDLRNPEVKRLLGAMRSVSEKIEICYGSSLADDNIIANSIGIPVVIVGPKGGNEHSADEWVSAQSLETLEKTYESIISAVV
jgi:acetylornithine deacetylase/succinyl-diaminopimelate desuccinylase-like protein